MSSFLASFFQPSSGGTISTSNKQATTTHQDNNKIKSIDSAKNHATAVIHATSNGNDIDGNHSNNDLVYMDTIQSEDQGEAVNKEVEPEERRHQVAVTLEPPPPRYFATHLPPHNTAIRPSTTKQQQFTTKNHNHSMNDRNRSMSRLFTTLPNIDDHGQHVPSYQQMMIDVMEYIMYIMLLETDTTKTIQVHSKNLMTVVQGFIASSSNTSNILQPSSHNHRVSNRMMITAFTCDILQLCSVQQAEEGTATAKEEGNNDENSDIVPLTAMTASELPPEGWMELKKSLQTLKNQLLNVNANDDPLRPSMLQMDENNIANFQTRPEEKQNHPRAKEKSNDDADAEVVIDEQLSNHVMMTIDYDTVMTLLSVQQVLATFREQLEDIKGEADDDERDDDDDEINNNSHSVHSSTTNTSQNMNKMVEICVNAFIKNLSELFPAKSDEMHHHTEEEADNDERVLLELEAEDDGDEDIAGESERTKTTSNHQNSYSATGIAIPHELHSLALIELYSPKKTKKLSQNDPLVQPTTTGGNSTSSNLVDRLLYDIQSIVTATMGRFSYANLIDKIRSLLLKWSQSILDVPALVRLGYGGVPSPIVEKEEDDVSSWGSNNNNHHQNINYMVGGSVLSGTSFMDDAQKQRRKSRNNGSKIRSSIGSALHATGTTSQQPFRNFSITAEEEDIIERLVATDTTKTSSVSTVTKQRKAHTSNTEESPIAQPDMNDVDALNPDDTRQPVLHSDNNSHSHGKNSTPVFRKIVKASRRLLTSFNYSTSGGSVLKNPKNSDTSGIDVVNQTIPFASNDNRNKKRTITDCMDDNDYLSITLDDTKRPEKILRRNNVWAMNQRMKMRLKGLTKTDSPLIQLSPINNDKNNDIKKGQLAYKNSTPSKGSNTPAKSVSSSTKKQQQRRFFSTIEVEALMDGVNTYGIGKWSMIQKNDIRLKHRTSIQLKDKYRNIVALPSSAAVAID